MFKIKLSLLSILFLALFALAANAQDDLQKGKDAIKRGDNLKAVEYLSKAVAKEQDYETYYYYGLALYRTGSIAKAEENLKKALAKDDEGIDAMIELGNIYSGQKKYDEANSLFKKGLKIEPDNINLLIAQADNFSAAGKIDDAIKALTLATTISKENPNVYVGLGDAYNIRGSFKLAADYYKKAIALKKIPSAYTGLGISYAKQKKYNEAIIEFDNALKADPNYAEAYYEKGKILYFGGKFQEALDAFSKYSELMPGSQEGKSYYAKVLYAQGVNLSDRGQKDKAAEKFDEALKILEGVLKNDPKSATGNLFTAYIYGEKADIDEGKKEEYLKLALEYFNKVSIGDYDVEDLQKLAKANFGINRLEDAFRNYNMAVNKDSTDDDSETYYEWGKTLYKAEKYEEALEKFKKSVELGNKSLFASFFMGLCNYSMKKYIDAVPYFQKVIEGDPQFMMGYEFLARAYRFANKDQESINVYEQILKMDPEHKEANDMIKALNARIKGNGTN